MASEVIGTHGSISPVLLSPSTVQTWLQLVGASHHFMALIGIDNSMPALELAKQQIKLQQLR